MAHAVFDDIGQDPGDQRRVILCIAGKDHREIRRGREVGIARSLPHLLIVVLRREREGVVDRIGVAGHRGAKLLLT